MLTDWSIRRSRRRESGSTATSISILVGLLHIGLLIVLLPNLTYYQCDGLSGGKHYAPRSRRSTTAKTSSSSSSSSIKDSRSNSVSKNKMRKQNAHHKQQQGMNRKLQADADFFWDCVSKRSRGKDIAGVSGKAWRRPSKQELFGHSPKEAALLLMQPNTAAAADTAVAAQPKVKRSGSGMDIPSMTQFDALDDGQLPDFVLTNLLAKDRMRYTTPTPVQQYCVPLALAGYDVLASAQTGSGKTVGFLLPLIASVAENRNNNNIVSGKKERRQHNTKQPSMTKRKTPSSPAALILAPTRELAIQIEQEIEKLTFEAPPPSSSDHVATRWSACCYGGATARPQLEALASGVEILVATPGRLADFLDRKLVSLSRCQFLVLDEADRMLDMGFEPQLNKIVEQNDMPNRMNRQTLLFSATFPLPLQAIAQKSYLRPDSARISVGTIGATNKAVEQRLIKVDGDGTKRDKLAILLALLQKSKKRRSTIVFTNKKHVAQWITKELGKKSIKCSQIHGDRTQGQRETALGQFRDGEVDVLIATDAVSRGIDIADVAHVIQFDLPFSDKEFESYTHRIGRTGRAGKTGIATSFYVPGYQPKIGNADLWFLIKKSFDESKMDLPDWFYQEESGNNRKGGGQPKRKGRINSSTKSQGKKLGIAKQYQQEQQGHNGNGRRATVRPPRKTAKANTSTKRGTKVHIR